MIVLGTRGSELALAQTREVVTALQAARPGLRCETRIVKTGGDIHPDRALEAFGGKGAFVKELDEHVLRGDVDAAVHSMKDVPTKIPRELVLAAVLPRTGCADVLVSDFRLDALPRGAVIGTGSVRRRAQMLRVRPDLMVKPIRGNVPTRIRKWRRGECDGLVLSQVGLERLGLDVPYEVLDPAVFVPEGGQGAVAVVCRRDSPWREVLGGADHAPTRVEVEVEREVLRILGGGCVVPMGVRAEWRGAQVLVHAMILSEDGRIAIGMRELLSARDHLYEADEFAEGLREKGGERLVAATIRRLRR